jgi:hypothetical protein
MLLVFVYTSIFLAACGLALKAPKGSLRALATDTARQLDILGHDGDALGMDGAQVGVLEQANKVGLGSLLKGEHSGSLEAEIGLEILSNLTDKALERQLADEELSALLVAADLTESHSSRAVKQEQLTQCWEEH